MLKELAQDFNTTIEEVEDELLKTEEMNMKSKNYKIEARTDSTKFITFNEKNDLGETLQIEMTKVTGEGKHFLGNLWAKDKYLEKPIKTYWVAMVYATDKDGACWGKYNVTTNHKFETQIVNGKREVVGSRGVINFLYICEATDDVFDTIVEDIAERFYECDDEKRYSVKYKDGATQVEIKTWDLGSVLDAKDIAVRQGYEGVDIYEDGELITWIG